MRKKEVLLFFLFFTIFLTSLTFAQTITWQSGYPKPISGGSIELKWNSITGATTYTIYRIEGDGNPYPAYTYTTSSSTTYTDKNTKDGILYSYVIATTVSGTTYTSSVASTKADKTKPQIENLSVIPNPFSPDGDGFRDKINLSFSLSEYATVTITLQDSTSTIYTLPDWNGKICPTPSTYNVEWDGYFGSTLATKGVIIYTITATDYAGNSNSASSRFILDIPNVTVANLTGTPNPFSGSLEVGKEYKASYTYFPIDTYSNTFNLSPNFYLDQSNKILNSISLHFDITPSTSQVSSTKVSIINSSNETVRTVTFTSSATFYWYGENNPELVKDDPNIINSWWWKITGNPIGDYKVVVEATYTMDLSGVTLEVPLKPLITNITLGEIITIPEDTTPPKVLTFSPPSGSLVSNINIVSAVIDDGNGVGPDLEASTIRVKDGIGKYIGGYQSNNGTDTIYWTFTSTLTSGYYTIEVVPIDKKGNKGGVATSSFIIDSSAPQIISIFPQNPISALSEIRVEYNDVGSGLNLWENYPYPPTGSYIEIFTPTGSSQKLLLSKSKTTSTIAIADVPSSLLSSDGVYNLGIYLVDKAANSTFTSTAFILDTTAPYIVSYSPSSTLINYTITQIQVIVRDDGVGLTLTDTAKTFLKLSTSSGDVTGTTYTYQSTSPNSATLILNIPATYVWQEGEYFLTVRATDRLEIPYINTIKFVLDTTTPKIISVSPSGNVSKVENIKVTYEETGSGVDFDKSQVNLGTPNGNVTIPFDKTQSTSSILIAPVSEDILAKDGNYNVSITLYDVAGNVTSTTTAFVLDRSKPYITKYLPTKNSIVVIPPSQISIEIKDDTVGIDVTPGKTYLKLKDPSGAEIGTYTSQVSSDSLTATLSINTASHTWTNGIHTVLIKVSDKLGNSLDETYTFTLNQVAQATGDLVVYPEVFSPSKGNLRIDFQFQAVSGNISKVTIEIYSLNGALVQKIYDNNFSSPQAQDTVTWNGKDNLGRLLPNGYYLVKTTIQESSGAVRIRFKGFVLLK